MMRSLARTTMGLAAMVLSADLATKAIAFAVVPGGRRFGLVLPVRNSQALLGIAPGSPGLISAVAAVLFGAFLWACLHLAHAGRVPRWVPGLVAGGAGANLVDRLISGAVHDWLIAGVAVVNLADVVLVTAAAGYTFGMLRSRRSARAQPSIIITAIDG